jgi:glycosyltransferase involved in cell wall biosynthesis
MLIVNEKNVIASIITISFNDLNNLKKTISLFSSYKGTNNIELIVVDGGSTDGTIEYLNNNSHLVDQWVSEPDDGIGDAWNKGFRLSKGRVVNFLNAGDRHLPEFLTESINTLHASPFNSG